MSDLLPHARTDLPFGDAPVVATSEYLNRPVRTLYAAVRDVSHARDLPVWVYTLLRPRPANVVSLAERRARLRGVSGL